jgi:hypothetical protein
MDTKMIARELKSGDTETTSENTLQGLRVGEHFPTSASAYSQADHLWDNHTKKFARALASHLPHEWHDTQNEKDLDDLPFILPDLPELPHPAECPITCYYWHCSVHQQRSNHQVVDLPPPVSDLQPRDEILAHDHSNGVPYNCLDALAALHITASSLDTYLQSKESFEQRMLGIPAASFRDFSLPAELSQTLSTLAVS